MPLDFFFALQFMQKHSVAAFIALLTLFAHLLCCVVEALQQTCRNEHDATESAHLFFFSILRRNNLINCLMMGEKSKGQRKDGVFSWALYSETLQV